MAYKYKTYKYNSGTKDTIECTKEEFIDVLLRSIDSNRYNASKLNCSKGSIKEIKKHLSEINSAVALLNKIL